MVYASQMRRRELHQFEPWPDGYSIGHVVRSRRSGGLIAGGWRGGESAVSWVLTYMFLTSLDGMLTIAGYAFQSWIKMNGHIIELWKRLCSNCPTVCVIHLYGSTG